MGYVMTESRMDQEFPSLEPNERSAREQLRLDRSGTQVLLGTTCNDSPGLGVHGPEVAVHHDDVVPRVGRSDRGQLTLWLELLECQTGLTLPFELPHYYGLQEWIECPCVLDLGTGPGYFLKALAHRFPNKSYLGVDRDAEYIAVARQDCPPFIRFDVVDLFSVSGTYPFVTARLVAQHVPSLQEFLTKVHDLLTPGGCFLSVEPNDELRAFHPSLRVTESMFAQFAEHRRQAGFNRAAGLVMAELATTHGLSLERYADVVVPSCLPTYRERFVTFHQLIVDIFAQAFEMSVDRTRVLAELHEWSSNPIAYAQLGVRWAVYRRMD